MEKGMQLLAWETSRQRKTRKQCEEDEAEEGEGDEEEARTWEEGMCGIPRTTHHHHGVDQAVGGYFRRVLQQGVLVLIANTRRGVGRKCRIEA